MGIIYKIDNLINNKCYIGKTSRSLEERWKEHLRHRFNLDYALYRAFKKYGVENFTISLLEENIEDETLLNEREKYWINYFKSNNKNYGYNMTLGGEGNIKYSTENMYSLWQQGYNLEQIQSILNIKRSGLVSSRLKEAGLVTEEEIKQRLKENSITNNIHTILQYDKNNNYIRSFNSSEEAARSLGKTSGSNIRSCCRGKLKTAYGYKWKYAD